MALIKCPKCGKEMSDRAECCPNCGMPLNKIKATTNPISQHKKNGVPKWVWILIIVGSLLIVGGIVFFCFLGESSNPEAVQEEEIAEITYPKITERGVEPFIINSSLLEIPSKGSFYDTIFINKYYDWCEKEGECGGKHCTESEYKRVYNEFNGNILVTRCYGIATIVKDRDTLMIIDYDENASITNITIMSDKFQMDNGLHVGMGATELLKGYNAYFVTQNEWHDGGTSLSNNIIVDIPSLPKHIIVISECNSKVTNYMNKKREEDGNYYDFNYLYTLPSEIVNDNVVSKIKIRNTVFDCYYEYYKEF